MKKVNKNILSKIRKEHQIINEILFNSKYLLDSPGMSEKNTSSNTVEVTWSNKDRALNYNFNKDYEITKTLKLLINNGQYTFLFYDYSILQVEYILQNNKIIKQRIQFIRNLNNYYSISTMEEYRNDWISEGDQFEFLELNKGVPFIIRADYDPSNHSDLKHAKSHMTISNIANCRIPLMSNITLTKFIIFILNHVYGEFKINIPETFNNCCSLTELEKKSLHINWTNNS